MARVINPKCEVALISDARNIYSHAVVVKFHRVSLLLLYLMCLVAQFVIVGYLVVMTITFYPNFVFLLTFLSYIIDVSRVRVHMI